MKYKLDVPSVKEALFLLKSFDLFFSGMKDNGFSIEVSSKEILEGLGDDQLVTNSEVEVLFFDDSSSICRAFRFSVGSVCGIDLLNRDGSVYVSGTGKTPSMAAVSFIANAAANPLELDCPILGYVLSVLSATKKFCNSFSSEFESLGDRAVFKKFYQDNTAALPNRNPYIMEEPSVFLGVQVPKFIDDEACVVLAREHSSLTIQCQRLFSLEYQLPIVDVSVSAFVQDRTQNHHFEELFSLGLRFHFEAITGDGEEYDDAMIDSCLATAWMLSVLN